MNASTEHRLDGFEPDNLLAFMALLGLLRALESAEPAWRPRAYWDEMRHPLRPVLTLAQAKTQDDVAAAAARGVGSLAQAHSFDRDNITYSSEEARGALFEAVSEQRLVLEALFSDGAVREKEDKVWPSPFCFLFGQGHQHFLQRLSRVPKCATPPKRGRGKAAKEVSAEQCLAEALFAPWRREDLTEGLRWDPAEDRRYALRADDPSGDPAGAQHGANRLAAIALPLFTTAVVSRRGETRLLARASSYGIEGAIQFTWPVWGRSATLAAIVALLAHPELARDKPHIDGAPLSVFGIMRAERISVGKFFNVTAAGRLG